MTVKLRPVGVTAQMLGIAPSTLYSWIAAQRVAVTVGPDGKMYIEQLEVDRLLDFIRSVDSAER